MDILDRNGKVLVTIAQKVLSGANLSNTDLSGADLRGADLIGANLRGASLSGASLKGTDLSGASLSNAYLSGANLRNADLSGADLSGAYLSGADLRNAYLSGADLRYADLSGADLSGADLRGADLIGANLRGASLSGAKLTALTVARLTIVPVEGAFIGWKKCRGDVIVQVSIPADAKRSNAISRKCRAAYVDVIGIFGGEEGISIHNPTIVYRVGSRVHCDKWNEDRWVECGGGIHFFLTREEAEAYN